MEVPQVQPRQDAGAQGSPLIGRSLEAAPIVCGCAGGARCAIRRGDDRSHAAGTRRVALSILRWSKFIGVRRDSFSRFA